MSDKERLEEIETKYSILTVSSEKNGTEYTEVDVEDLVFLIQNGFEQAEKVEELELEVNDWRAEVQKWQQFYEESEESYLKTKELLKSIVNQSKRYREALKNIYELAEYDEYDNTLEQIVSEIKKALEESK